MIQVFSATCRHLERMPVTLSPFASLRGNPAKGLARWAKRSFPFTSFRAAAHCAQDDIRAHLWAKMSALGCKLERLQKIEKQWTLPYTLCRSARSWREILRCAQDDSQALRMTLLTGGHFWQDDNSDRMTRLKRLRLIGINHTGGTLYGFDCCSGCTAARRRDHPLCFSSSRPNAEA